MSGGSDAILAVDESSYVMAKGLFALYSSKYSAFFSRFWSNSHVRRIEFLDWAVAQMLNTVERSLCAKLILQNMNKSAAKTGILFF